MSRTNKREEPLSNYKSIHMKNPHLGNKASSEYASNKNMEYYPIRQTKR